MRAIAHRRSFAIDWNLDAEVKRTASVTQSTLVLSHGQYAHEGQNGIVEALRTPDIIRPYRDMVDHYSLRFDFAG
jgi:hypothetical protein